MTSEGRIEGRPVEEEGWANCQQVQATKLFQAYPSHCQVANLERRPNIDFHDLSIIQVESMNQ